jgi:hypothetical protein
MGLSLQITIDQLKEILNQLNPVELKEVKAMLDEQSLEKDLAKRNKQHLKELLLNGPTLSKEELEKIKEARNFIHKWRAE